MKLLQFKIMVSIGDMFTSEPSYGINLPYTKQLRGCPLHCKLHASSIRGIAELVSAYNSQPCTSQEGKSTAGGIWCSVNSTTNWRSHFFTLTSPKLHEFS